MINLPEQYINYSVVLIIFALFQALLILIIIYFFITKVLSAKREHIDDAVIKQEAYDRSLKILEEAKEEALKVLTTAQEKAREVMEDTTFFSETAKGTIDKEVQRLISQQSQNMEKLLDEQKISIQRISETQKEIMEKYYQEQKSVMEQLTTQQKDEMEKLSGEQRDNIHTISQEMVGVYREAIEEDKDKGVAELQGATEQLTNKMNQELDEYEKVLEKHTIESEEEAKEKVNVHFENVKKQIEEYRDKRLDEIDSKIQDMLPQLSREILGNSMTLEDHESAIFAALEKAKKEKVFEV